MSAFSNSIRRRVGTCVLLAASFVAASPSAAQSVSPASSAQTPQLQLPSRLSANTRATIEQLADSLRSAGVPSEPLYDKAAEGVLKGADDARILSAIRTLARELGTASAVLGTAAPVSDVVSAASALRAGVPRSALQKLASRKSKSAGTDGRLSLSFIILADFAARGVPMDAAVNAIDALLVRGAGGAQLNAFSNGVVRDLQAGRDPRTTLTTRVDGAFRKQP